MSLGFLILWYRVLGQGPREIYHTQWPTDKGKSSGKLILSLASGRRDLEECSSTIPQSTPSDNVRAPAGSPNPTCTRGASTDCRAVLWSCLAAQKHKNMFHVSSAGWTLEMHLSAGTEWPHQYQRTKQTRRAKEGLWRQSQCWNKRAQSQARLSMSHTSIHWHQQLHANVEDLNRTRSLQTEKPKCPAYI